MEIAILASGCFWGPEIKFSKLRGIIKTEVGYCGGNKQNTTYKDVCSGDTNHAEVVKSEFDSNLISGPQKHPSAKIAISIDYSLISFTSCCYVE